MRDLMTGQKEKNRETNRFKCNKYRGLISNTKKKMPQCAVDTCGNYYGKTRDSRDIMYHMLPGDPELAAKWVNACGKKEKKFPYYARVCSDHFSEKCYQRDLQHELLGLPLRKRLKIGAIPDRNLPKTAEAKVKENIGSAVKVITKNPHMVAKNTTKSNNIDLKKIINKNLNKKIPDLRTALKQEMLPGVVNVDVKNVLNKKPNPKMPKIRLLVPKKQKIKKLNIIDEKTRITTGTHGEITITKTTRDESGTIASDILKEKEDKDRSPKINNKLNKLPLRSSFRIAKKKSIECLSDSFTKKINNKGNKPERFTDKVRFMAKLQLKFERKENLVTLPRYDLEESLNKMIGRGNMSSRNTFPANYGDMTHAGGGLQGKARTKAESPENGIRHTNERNRYGMIHIDDTVVTFSDVSNISNSNVSIEMPQCAIVGCNNTHRKTKGRSVKYHRFPGHSGTRKLWLEACGKPLNNYLTARICSRHFSEGNYERDVQHELLGLPTRCRLKKGAIPDQNLPDDFLKEDNQPDSAIAILLAVGLVPTNKSDHIGGLPQDLNKMQIMDDVREGCDANPPSSPGHAEQGQLQLDDVKSEDVVENGIDDESEDNKEMIEIKENDIKDEVSNKNGDEDIEEKQDEHSDHSSTSETTGKRTSDCEPTLIKRLKTDSEDNFSGRDRIINEFAEITECNSIEQIQVLSDQILSEIRTLNELAKEKEREWNNILHMKKLKEELLIRLQRKRQVLLIDETDLNDPDPQPETNGQQSLLKSNIAIDMLRDLRVAKDNLDKLKQRSRIQKVNISKPMLDVQSIIADYRQRHPEIVPRRGGNRLIAPKLESENGENGLLGNLNGSREESPGSCQNSWYRSGDEVRSYKDILLQFAKLSQAEQSEIQMQLQATRPPPPYPEVTVHPVTSTSSVTPTNSLLHGILTKAPLRQSHSNGNGTKSIINGGKSSFSPTLARLLTAPEKAGASQLISAPNILAGSIMNPTNLSLSDIFPRSKVRNEITITPVGSQCETSTKRQSLEEESEDQTDRLVIDESLDQSNVQLKDDNRSEDGEDVPQCQGCNQKAAQFVCAGCGNQWYCSRECQVAAWDDHSEVCSG